MVSIAQATTGPDSDPGTPNSSRIRSHACVDTRQRITALVLHAEHARRQFACQGHHVVLLREVATSAPWRGPRPGQRARKASA